MMLERLTYASRALIAPLSPEFLAIIRSSDRNNRRLGLTGALYFDASLFFQVLEGPRAALDAIFERIRADERHCDVRLLSREGAPTRRFESWTLKLVEGRGAAGARSFGFADMVRADAAELDRRVDILSRA